MIFINFMIERNSREIKLFFRRFILPSGQMFNIASLYDLEI